MIKGKYNLYAYSTIFFILFFFLPAVYFLSHPHLVLKGKAGHTFPAILPGFLFLFGALILFYVLARVIYIVQIGADRISIKGAFKRKLIQSSDIKAIDLFSKEDLYWSVGSVTIVTRIELTTGETIIIADPFYSNISEIKQALSENFKDKIKPYRKDKSNRTNQTDIENDFEKFAGNPYTSLNMLMFVGFAVLFILIPLFKQNLKPGHLLLIVLVFFIYLAFGSQLNYFLLSNQRLVVRNHLLFWVNRIYDIDEIVEVDFESPHKRSNALRITTSDFRSRLYGAGSLRDRHWIALKEKLKSVGIYFVGD